MYINNIINKTEIKTNINNIINKTGIENNYKYC